MLYPILIGVAAVIVLFVIVVALRPPDLRVSRSATIDAPPSVVFPLINDLHHWDRWSPWEKLDPGMKKTFAGAPEGVGASYTWSGNNKVGEGTNTIVESRPDELVGMKLEFRRPFAGTNAVEFTLVPQGHQTVVMNCKCNFIMKAVGLFMSMDKMCGAQFEEGLANLNTVVTAPAKV
jgi:uncharacterized protein YndB with AHSA1/START domain